jgi:hypothetical protein
MSSPATPEEGLLTHRGGLIRLRTSIYWWGERNWQDFKGVNCAVIDVQKAPDNEFIDFSTAMGKSISCHTVYSPRYSTADKEWHSYFRLCVLLEGRLRWIWLSLSDIEVINDTSV